MQEGITMTTEQLLELYPEFKALWKAARDNKTLKYYVRKAVLEHHKEMLA